MNTPDPRSSHPAPDARDSADVRGAGEDAAVGSAGEPAGAARDPAGDASGAGDAAGAGAAAGARRRDHAVRGVLAAGLILEGITVLFVPLTVARIGDNGLSGSKLALLLVLAVALFAAAGIQKRRAGQVVGSVLQVAVIATGVMVGAMYFLGLLFACVWAYLLWIRAEIARAAVRAGAPR